MLLLAMLRSAMQSLGEHRMVDGVLRMRGGIASQRAHFAEPIGNALTSRIARRIDATRPGLPRLRRFFGIACGTGRVRSPFTSSMASSTFPPHSLPTSAAATVVSWRSRRSAS